MAYNDFSTDNLWLPFTPNRSFNKSPRIMVAASGMHFTTHDGRQVVDGISSLWCVGAGHNRKPINEAIKKQLDTLDYSTAFNAANDQAFKAAGMIAAMCPGDLNKVLFCNSGSEAADTSMKVALAYHRARGEGHRTLFIGRERGYHGVGFGGMSVGGIPANRKAYGGALLPRVDHMRFIHDASTMYYNGQTPQTDTDFLDDLEKRILPLHDASNVAAIVVEPVAGSAGWYVPPADYLKRLRAICDKHGILLIFDEVITGFGRLGVGFGADYFGVVPDMLNFAKCVTNGVIPLGGVVCRPVRSGVRAVGHDRARCGGQGALLAACAGDERAPAQGSAEAARRRARRFCGRNECGEIRQHHRHLESHGNARSGRPHREGCSCDIRPGAGNPLCVVTNARMKPAHQSLRPRRSGIP